jgi:hypothetical protein
VVTQDVNWRVRHNAQDAKAQSGGMKRTIKLAGGDAGQVWISHRTIGSSKPTDYENLDTRQLRRLLRAANVETSGKEEDPALRLMLRYQLECDDALTDDSLMPKKLERCAALAPRCAPQCLASGAPAAGQPRGGCLWPGTK